MKSIAIEQTREMLCEVCRAVIGQKPYLTEVDSKIGDGDHGIGMAGGMEKAEKALTDKTDFDSVNEVFKTMGMAKIGRASCRERVDQGV